MAIAKRHGAYMSKYLQTASFRSAFQDVGFRIGALLGSASARFASSHEQPTGVQALINAVTFADFLALLDQSIVRPEYVRNLWDQAAAGGATAQRAAVWLLTCKVEDECSAASSALGAADKTHFRINGPTFGHPNDAGRLQHELLTFIWKHPGSMIIVTQPEKLHINSLKVLANAISESGQLQLSGWPAPSKRTTFLFMARCDQARSSTDKDAVISGWGAQSPSTQASDAVYASAVVLGFRRQVDAVLPLRKLPGVLSEGSDAPSASAITDFWRGTVAQRSMQAYHMAGELLDNLMRKRKAKV
ncbi:hypothetical protein PLESTB_001239800 [Pleodorina starrii]|uniref:Uncharacterized protein n=1 Tax=Pleodorina starrii TaxID=330485 RepID=A0A9W6F6F5_9CHLO|nr:hypothetical protein PLESTB_001239800 [Pleodorina starrii]GLC63223.1 hypothetical protein PLESTF_000013400 [Pleodorina starrii]